MEKYNVDKINTLLELPCFVVDYLPEQVKAEGDGQFYTVEQYYLKHMEKKRLYQKFVDILLKLNCYYDFEVKVTSENGLRRNPKPEILAQWVLQCCSDEKNCINIIIAGENSMFVINGDELCMSIYNPGDRLLMRVQALAGAEGLFVWQP